MGLRSSFKRFIKSLFRGSKKSSQEELESFPVAKSQQLDLKPPTEKAPFNASFDPSTLSCDNHEVSVDATIDYVDRYGNATRREITTEQIYDYEDGVVVIRAFCHKRKNYRTFISSRIKYWLDTNSGKPVSLQNLSIYLVKASQVDLANIAINISSMAGAEVQVFIHAVGKYTRNTYTSRNGLTYYRVSVPLVNALVDYLLELPRSRVLT